MAAPELADTISTLENFSTQYAIHGRVRRMRLCASLALALALLMAFVFVFHGVLMFVRGKIEHPIQNKYAMQRGCGDQYVVSDRISVVCELRDLGKGISHA